jgi:hypothetical protein
MLYLLTSNTQDYHSLCYNGDFNTQQIIGQRCEWISQRIKIGSSSFILFTFLHNQSNVTLNIVFEPRLMLETKQMLYFFTTQNLVQHFPNFHTYTPDHLPMTNFITHFRSSSFTKPVSPWVRYTSTRQYLSHLQACWVRAEHYEYSKRIRPGSNDEITYEELVIALNTVLRIGENQFF